MSSVNKVFLLGNLTKNPEVKYTPKGTAVCQVGMAMNRYWTNDAGEKQEDVTFVDVTFRGRQAEVLSEYAKKGKQIHVEGRLQLDTWDDKQTGEKRYRLQVIGESLVLLKDPEGRPAPDDRRDRGKERGEAPARTAEPSTSHRHAAPPPARRPPPDPDLDAAEDSDIPF